MRLTAFQILKVTTKATQEEIKKSYYRLAHIHHPDKGGKAVVFKLINTAYNLINTEQKKAHYITLITPQPRQEYVVVYRYWGMGNAYGNYGSTTNGTSNYSGS